MKYRYLFLVLFLSAFACNTSKKEVKAPQAPLMYEPSEMALLMRGMYEYNKTVKTQIINLDSLLPFPEDFLNLHTAVLTDPEERDAAFDSLSIEFLEAQKATFSSTPGAAKEHFNRSIRLCISCHETRCTGPIPKIKKLYIH